MKYDYKLLLCLLLILANSLNGQVLEVPTLKSKEINGEVTSIVWHQHQYVAEKGLVYMKKDIETYDDKGRLVSTYTENYNNKQAYKTVYELDKKGGLKRMQILNPRNNQVLQSTDYDRKKGLLVKTTQTQGANTVVKNYGYDKQKRLVQVEVIQNGTQSMVEMYELDASDRKTKISRKLPGVAEPKVVSTFTYTENDTIRTSQEHRYTEQGEFEITKETYIETNRDRGEYTKKVGTTQQGTSNQLFEDDDSGNWIKGEVLDKSYSRARLVLRQISYANGTTTGRDALAFPDDYRAQYIRQYSQKQVAVNGKIYSASSVFDLDYSNDRICYVSALNAWLLLKGYDDVVNRSAWTEARVIEGGKGKVLWAASTTGIDVYQDGKEMPKSGNLSNGYSGYNLGGSVVAYARGDIHKSFLAQFPQERKGELVEAELTDDHHYWGKVSDSTYVLTAFGKAVGIQKQIEDKAGNKLAMLKLDGSFYWYLMPEFRRIFDSEKVGTIHPAALLEDPAKSISEDKLLALDFSSFTYIKKKDQRYSLISADGSLVTNIASLSVKTPDDQLITYFPLTGQYLQMEDYYTLEEGKEWPDQKVNVVLSEGAHAYYIYNEGKSIAFYKPGARFSKYAFKAHKLDREKNEYGALLYDSLSNVSYGMNYDLASDQGFGAMNKLPLNYQRAYLLKLNGGRWVIFEKGQKISNYDFSLSRNANEVVHFFKYSNGKAGAYFFKEFDKAAPGAFLSAEELSAKEVKDLMTELGVDPELKPKEKQN